MLRANVRRGKKLLQGLGPGGTARGGQRQEDETGGQAAALGSIGVILAGSMRLLPSVQRMMTALTATLAWLRAFIAEKQANPDDSLTAKIVNGEIDGRPLTADEQIGTIFFLWLGGLDTVASTLGQMFRRLAMDHALQQRLRDDLSLIPTAIEEFLRVQPLVFSFRQLKTDLTLHGVEMKAGDWCSALTSLANFDPDAFQCPRSFDPARKANRHFTLASGAHLCLGAHLARLEMTIALETWLTRVPMFSIASDDKREVFPGLMSVTNLKLTW